MGLVLKASEKREFEDMSVKIAEFLAGLVEGNDCRLQLGFSFRFLVCCVDVVKIGVSQFAGKVELSPNVVDDMLVNVVLLDLDPVITEVAS